MTDAIEFGPEIKRGSPLWPEGQGRPVWLADDVRTWFVNDQDFSSVREARDIGFFNVLKIKIPASHPASIAQRWSDDNPGEKPWDRPHVGNSIPSDWNGGDVLFECGSYWKPGRQSFREEGLIIAYRSKPSEQTVEDDGYVRIAVMSEVEARVSVANAHGYSRASNATDYIIRDYVRLGIIRETPVERFKRENPGLSADELLEKALAR